MLTPLILNPMYKQPQSVQVVIFAGGGSARKYLLLRRIASHGGFWQSVTGSLELGESPEQAAVREVQEETGIEASIGSLIDLRLKNVFKIAPEWLNKYAAGTVYNEEVCFALKASEIVVRLDSREHDEYQWAGYDESMRLLFWESSKRAFAATNRIENQADDEA